MTYQEIVDYLYHLPRFTKNGHMENVRKFLQKMGNPQDSFQYIHVAGTNGKGSVCAYMESGLRLCHKKTGLFTSPHLVRINERICVDGQQISDDDFARIFNRIQLLVEKERDNGYLTPTFFEYLYLMAMDYFREQKVEYGVVEAGLGGRGDFTNVIEHPRLTVIMPVGMDHMQILGDTLEEIAWEKAGIIKSGCACVSSYQEESPRRVIADYAQTMGVVPVFLEKEDYEIQEENGKTIDFCMDSVYHGRCNFVLHTAANYQVQNAATAVLGLEELWKDEGFSLDFQETVAKALAQMRWPGRMEELEKDFYVDGAHNAPAAKVFCEAVGHAFGSRSLYLIFAVAADKDYRAIISLLAGIPTLRGVVVTEIESERHCSREIEEEIFRSYWKGTIKSTGSIEEAIKLGKEMRGEDGVLCCVGSLYLVGSVKERIGGGSIDQF